MTTKAKKPSKALLKKTAKLYDAALEHINSNGFDIGTYGRLDKENGKRPACYIGTLRIVAGAYPSPEHSTSGIAHLGDGPELELALIRLDEVAKRTRHGNKVMPYVYDESNLNPVDVATHPGRFVEAFGLMIADKSDMDESEQEKYATTLLKRALTKIYDELEAA